MAERGKYWDEAVRLAVEVVEAERSIAAAEAAEISAAGMVRAAQDAYKLALVNVERTHRRKADRRSLLKGATASPEEMADAVREARRLLSLEKRASRAKA